MDGKWEFTDNMSKGGSEKLCLFTWKMKWDGEQTEIMQIGCHRQHQEQRNGPNNKLPVWLGGQQGTTTSVQKTEEEQPVRWYMNKAGLREWEQEIMSTKYTETGWRNGIRTNLNTHG